MLKALKDADLRARRATERAARGAASASGKAASLRVELKRARGLACSKARDRSAAAGRAADATRAALRDLDALEREVRELAERVDGARDAAEEMRKTMLRQCLELHRRVSRKEAWLDSVRGFEDPLGGGEACAEASELPGAAVAAPWS
jgi:hypothetical protein